MKNILPFYFLLAYSAIALGSDDPYFNRQWALQNDGQTVAVEMDDTHTLAIPGMKGADVDVRNLKAYLQKNLVKKPIVAVLDSGIEEKHPDLQNSIVPGGKDFTTADVPSQTLDDKLGHGTHTAGIIAATADNKLGVSGVSDLIRILPLKIAPVGKGIPVPYADRLANGIRYATSQSVDVINLSLGFPIIGLTDNLRGAIKDAVAKGIVVVAATGNLGHGITPFPCSAKDVICVGSIRGDGNVSNFSNQSGHVDLLAPGEMIISTFPSLLTPKHITAHGYAYLSGTSESTPFVSAAAALLKGVYPKITLNEIMARLYESALERPNGFKDSLAGLVQITSALTIKPKPSIRPVFKELADIIVHTDGTFSVSIPIKNYWISGSGLSAEVTSDNADISFVSSHFEIGSLVSGESKIWNLSGKLKTLDTESKNHISITIRTAEKTESYDHLFTFSLLPSDIKKVTYTLPGLKSSDAITQYSDSFSGLNIHSIPDESGLNRLPQYYMVAPNKNGQIISFYFKQAGQYAQKNLPLPNSIHLVEKSPGSVSPQAVKQIHYTTADEIGYVVRFIDKDSKDPYKNEHFLYLDSEFNPKFGDRSYLSFTDLEAYSFSDTLVKWIQLPYGQSMIPVPAELMKGYVPNESSLNPFEKDTMGISNLPGSIGMHLYYLTPSWEHANLTVNVVDTHDFLNDLYRKNGLNWEDAFFWTNSLQAPLGKSQFSFRTQNSNALQDWVLSIGDNLKLDITRVSSKVDLSGSRLSSLIQINSTSGTLSAQATAQAWFQSPYLIQFGTLDGISSNSLEFRANWQQDPIAYVLNGFSYGSQTSFFVQSGFQMIAVQPNGQSFTQSKYPLYRSQLIDPSQNLALYQPVSVKSDDGNFIPGFFIDMTGIDINMAYVVALGKQGLYSPIWSAYHSIPGCKFSNPVSDQGVEKLALVCKDGDAVKLQFISLENDFLQ